MNNKGFTLIEVVLTVTIVSLLFIIVIVSVNKTFALTNERAYEISKKNIKTIVDNYIYECENNLIGCDNDYSWIVESNYKSTSFYLNVLNKYDYFDKDDLINPITNNKLDDCMIISVVKKDDGIIDINLDDSNCVK